MRSKWFNVAKCGSLRRGLFFLFTADVVQIKTILCYNWFQSMTVLKTASNERLLNERSEHQFSEMRGTSAQFFCFYQPRGMRWCFSRAGTSTCDLWLFNKSILSEIRCCKTARNSLILIFPFFKFQSCCSFLLFVSSSFSQPTWIDCVFCIKLDQSSLHGNRLRSACWKFHVGADDFFATFALGNKQNCDFPQRIWSIFKSDPLRWKSSLCMHVCDPKSPPLSTFKCTKIESAKCITIKANWSFKSNKKQTFAHFS